MAGKQEKLEFIRGTTPTIIVDIDDDIDLSIIKQVWMYIWQSKKLVVDKILSDVTIDPINKIITLRLSQDDTLACKEGEAIMQIRLLLDDDAGSDDSALANVGWPVKIYEIYKGGVIE